MRCLSCNVILTNFEATRRVASDNSFLDLCSHCYKDIEEEVPTVDSDDFNLEEEE